MRHFRKPLMIILIILIASLLITTAYESIATDVLINDFKNRGVLVHTQNNQRFYLVQKEKEYEDTSRRVLENFDNNQIGYTGDIYLTSRNPVPSSASIKILSEFIWIGHSALVIDEEAKQTIEITGNDVNNDNVVKVWDNTWYDDLIEETKEFAVLRVKNTNVNTTLNVVSSAKANIGKPYNYSIIFNTKNSFYCTDLITRSYKDNGINIDYDGLISTGVDMILSKNTYLVYYRQRVIENNEVFYNIYYLGD